MPRKIAEFRRLARSGLRIFHKPCGEVRSANVDPNLRGVSTTCDSGWVSLKVRIPMADPPAIRSGTDQANDDRYLVCADVD